MAEPLLIPTYHDVVIKSLQNIGWVLHADVYPEDKTQLETPAVFMSISGWDNQASGDGQLSISLDVDLFVVVDRSSVSIDKPDIYVRAAAADLTQFIQGQQFNLTNVDPAIFVSASPDEFDPEMDDYLVWRISYTQNAAIGEDPDASNAALLSEAWLGKAPDIGRAHITDYQLIYKRGPDE